MDMLCYVCRVKKYIQNLIAKSDKRKVCVRGAEHYAHTPRAMLPHQHK